MIGLEFVAAIGVYFAGRGIMKLLKIALMITGIYVWIGLAVEWFV